MFFAHTFISELCKIKCSTASRLQPIIIVCTLKYSGHIAEKVSALYMKIIPRFVFFNEFKEHNLEIYYICFSSFIMLSTVAAHSLNCSKEFGCLDNKIRTQNLVK